MTGAPRPEPTGKRAPRATRLGIAAVLIPISAFSVMNVIVKIARLEALAFAFYRLWIGVAIMLWALYLTGRRLSWAILRRAAPGGVLFGANLAFFFAALKATSVADVLIIAALQPALTLIVAGPLFGERVTSKHLTWTGVSLAGVILVVVGSTGTPVWSLRGDLYAVGALFAWTIYWILSKRVRETLPAFEYMTAVTLTAALVVTPLTLASGQGLRVRWEDWIWLVVFVVGAQAGHTVLAWSHAQVDVSVSSVLILAEPVIAAVAALIFLGEPLPATSILGGLVTVAAVGMVVWHATRRREQAALPPEIAPA